MAGLTSEGFIASEYQEIHGRISGRLDAFSPGIDLSSEAPDGALTEIFSFELAQAWAELGNVYSSNDPMAATGAGLRNVGMLSGLPFGAATRSQANVDLLGVAGTVVPAGSLVSDESGNEFATSFDATIPATVQAVAKLSGAINVEIGSINTMASSITGWTSVDQPTAGLEGGRAQTETQYRNLRNKTVLRNFTSVEDVVKARLVEDLGIEQVTVLNNDSPATPLPDGTPAGTIHVTVGEIDPTVSDLAIATVIMRTKGLGCPTYGSTSVLVDDDQGYPHTVRFSKATPVGIFMNIEVLFLDDDFAGASDAIRADLVTHINSLATDEDVVWSRLFGIITPYAKAQVNLLQISDDGASYVSSNLAIGADEYANTTGGSINITVVN